MKRAERKFDGTIFHCIVVNASQEYFNWEREIVDLIIEQWQVPNGDAQGIVEANVDMVVESWKQGLSPEETVQAILKKTKKE